MRQVELRQCGFLTWLGCAVSFFSPGEGKWREGIWSWLGELIRVAWRSRSRDMLFCRCFWTVWKEDRFRGVGRRGVETFPLAMCGARNLSSPQFPQHHRSGLRHLSTAHRTRKRFHRLLQRAVNAYPCAIYLVMIFKADPAWLSSSYFESCFSSQNAWKTATKHAIFHIALIDTACAVSTM